MYLLWNWTDKAEDVVVTFYWSDGSGHFKLPFHLEAWGSATIDMANVVARGQPDADGNVIPARVRQGSAVFASPKGVNSPISLAIWGAHFSAGLGVAEACCFPCLGFSGFFIGLPSGYPISSFESGVGQSIQLYAQAYYSNGALYDFTNSATWSSSDTAVASVAAGLLNGVGLGSSTITASVSLQQPGERSFGCGGCGNRVLQVAYAAAGVKQAVPYKFKITGASDQGGGVAVILEATFSWQSSDGKLPDLSNCNMREDVTYPNTNNSTCPNNNPPQSCYYPPSPPWPKNGQPGSGYPNPTIPPPGPANGGSASDLDSVTNLSFVKPYSANSFNGTQYYQYSCNGGSSWTNIYGPTTITRSMSQNSNKKWVVTVSRSDWTATSTYVIPGQ